MTERLWWAPGMQPGSPHYSRGRSGLAKLFFITCCHVWYFLSLCSHQFDFGLRLTIGLQDHLWCFAHQLLDCTLKQDLVGHLGILPSTTRVSEGKTNAFPTAWPRKISTKLLSTMICSSMSRLRHSQHCSLVSHDTMQHPPSHRNPRLARQHPDTECESSIKQPPRT